MGSNWRGDYDCVDVSAFQKFLSRLGHVQGRIPRLDTVQAERVAICDANEFQVRNFRQVACDFGSPIAVSDQADAHKKISRKSKSSPMPRSAAALAQQDNWDSSQQYQQVERN